MTSLRNEKLEFAQLAVIDCNYSQVTGSYAAVAATGSDVLTDYSRPGAGIHERRLSECDVIGARPYQPNRFVTALEPR